MTIDELKVVITAQNQDFNRKIDAVNQRMNGMIQQSGKVDKSMKQLSGTFSKMAKIAAAAFSIRAIYNFGKQTSEIARTAEANLQRVNDIFGSSSAAVKSFADQNRASLGMSRADVYQFSATYGNLFSTFMSSQQENAAMTQAYLNATAVVASKTGRTVEDVAERMRSGLLGNTEAIEDLGINVNIKTIEITDAFKRIANGRSWEQLNAYEQAQVRQLAILEQATNKYGTTVANNSSFAFQQASAAIKDFQTIIGNLINTAIVPLINLFTELLTKVNSFLEAIFGKQISQQNQSAAAAENNAAAMGDLADQTEQAGKAAKGALAPFDELNVISATSSQTTLPSLGSDIGTGGNAGQNNDESISKWELLADKIKKKFEEIMNHPFVVWLKDKLGDAVRFVNGQFQKFKEWLDEIKIPLGEIIGKLKDATDKMWKFLEPLADQCWEEFKDTLNDIRECMQKVISSCLELYNKFLDLRDAVLKFLDSIGALEALQKQLSYIISVISGIVKEFVTFIGDKAEEIELKLGGITDFLTGTFTGDWEKAWNGLKDVFHGFKFGIETDVGLFKGIFGKITTYLSDTWENVKTFFKTALTKVGEFFNSLPQKLGYLLGRAAAKVTEWGVKMVEWAKTKPKEIIDNIVKFFKELPGKIKEIWNDVIEFINKLPGRMYNLGKNLLTGIWNGIVAVKDWLFQKISDFFGGFLDGFLDEKGVGKGSQQKITPIPKLASGGIVTAPTLAMVGEYSGAAANPEIVAPQSTMRETFLDAVWPLVDAVLEGTDNVVRAINEKDTSVYLDSSELSARLYDPLNRERTRRGNAVIAY